MVEPHPVTAALIAAMSFSGEPMVLTDPNQPDHPMIAINAPFEAMSGYPPADTLGRNCRFLQGHATDPATRARIGRCIAERRGCVEWIVNYRRSGEMFWNLLFITPVFARGGELLHFFGNQRDITEGRPPDLPDYSFGKADLPAEGLAEFNRLLLDVMEQTDAARADPSSAARALEGLVEAARRLNDVTTNLAPAPWSPPPA
jgi:PAS domain S-box-containing protein